MLPDAQNRIRWICIGAALLGITLHHSNGPRLQHGLTATYFYDSDFSSIASTRVENVAMASSNDKLIPHDRPFSIRWDGYLWTNQTRDVVFTIPKTLGARLLLNGNLVNHPHGDDHSTPFTLTYQLNPGTHSITLELERPKLHEQFFSTGLQWKSFLGHRLITSTFLYTSLPDTSQARTEYRLSQVRLVGAWMAALSTLGLIGMTLANKRRILAKVEIWGLLFIIATAFCLRLIYLRDVVVQIPTFDAFPIGSDHRSYESAARDFVRGMWPPPSEFYRQPGFTWILGTFHAIISPNLRLFQVAQIISGAISSAVIYAIGKRIFNATTGWIAAIVWAIFPLAIFYDAQFVTHGLEAHIVVWLMWVWISAIERPSPVTLATLGIILGCAAVIRPALLAFIPFAAISIAWTSRPRWIRGIMRGFLLLGLASLPILPVTFHNYQHTGRFQLISANGPVTLYLGNNRNAAGIGQYSQAFRATHERVNRGETTYIGATLSDIRSSPRRWLTLMTRKTALYFANPEIPNNVDFVREGIEVSKLLANTPIRYGTIVALGLTGLALAISRPHYRNHGVWLLAAVITLLYLTTVIFHIVTRFRVPTYGPLIILSAFALAESKARFTARGIRASAFPLGLLAASSALVISLPWLADNSMSLPTLSKLPDDTVQVQAIIHETLELSGYDHVPAVEPGEPLFITLYWKPNSLFTTDYYGTVQLMTLSNEKIAQVDQEIGSGSFPIHPTNRWIIGEVVTDQYLLFLPRDIPTPIVLSPLIAIYNRATGERIGETTLGPISVTYGQPLALSSNVTPVNASIGPALLEAYGASFENNEIAVTLFWTAITRPSVDGTVFIHVFDSSGNFVFGEDLSPRAGQYPMTAWQRGEGITDPRRIPLSNLRPGKYSVLIGIYDPLLGTRFSITDHTGRNIPDASLMLFEVNVD